jgi:hypothetical protein
MDRKEALEFLELPEYASPAEIKEKIETKLAYFENLSEKAPSPFVRKLHARNVARVKEIKTLSKDWPAARAPVYTQPVTIPEMIKNEQATPAPVAEMPPPPPPPPPPPVEVAPPVVEAPPPVAAAPAAPHAEAPIAATPAAPKAEAPAPPPAAPQAASPAPPPVEETPAATTSITRTAVRYSKPARDPNEPLAWLVRHTENQSNDTYPIHTGKNYIGRKEKAGSTPFIAVKEDPYISKVHAVVIAEPGEPATFYLADDPATNGDKASTNGTYLNGNGDRITKKTLLQNNDTIQVGITKLIFRYNDNPLDRILKEVAGKDYVHTVVIDVL